MRLREVSPPDEAVTEALKRPSDFSYVGDQQQMFVTWALGPILCTRDSSVREATRHNKFLAALGQDKTLEGEWEATRCHHFAYGWVEHLSFHAIDEEGKPTRMFRIIYGRFRPDRKEAA